MRHAIISTSDRLHLRDASRGGVCGLRDVPDGRRADYRTRYVFSSPPVWTEDVARYAMVWTGLLGATLSFKTRSDAVLMDSVFPEPPT